MKALDDLLWLKARLEDERDFEIHVHPTLAAGREAAKRILARIQPAIDALRKTQKEFVRFVDDSAPGQLWDVAKTRERMIQALDESV